MVARLGELPGAGAARRGAGRAGDAAHRRRRSWRCRTASQVRAALVVAADGRDSAVREALGIGARRWGYGQKALVFTVTHALPHEGVSTEIHRSGGPFTLVPLPDRDGAHCSAVVWMEAGPRAAELAAMPEAAFEAALNAARLRRARARSGSRAARRLWPIVAQVADAARRAAHGAGGRGGARGAADRGAGAEHEPRATSRRCSISAPAARAAGGDIGAPELLARYHRARHGDMLLRIAGIDALNRAAMAGRAAAARPAARRAEGAARACRRCAGR